MYMSKDSIKPLTIQQLREYKGEEFAEEKEKLFCPHEGCSARLIFREGAGGYYAKSRESTHDEQCVYKEDGETRAQRYEVIGTIYGTMSDDDIKSKHKYAWKRVAEFRSGGANDQTANPPRKKAKKKVVSESEEKTLIVQISNNPNRMLSAKEAISEGVKQRSEKFYFRFLHNVTRKDYPKNLNVVANLTAVEQEDTLQGKFSIEYQGIKGELLFPEAFYSVNKNYRAEQLINFLKIIKNYINETPIEIMVAGLCHATDGGLDRQPYKFAVYNPDSIEFMLLNGRTASIVTLVQYIKTKVV